MFILGGGEPNLGFFGGFWEVFFPFRTTETGKKDASLKKSLSPRQHSTKETEPSLQLRKSWICLLPARYKSKILVGDVCVFWRGN